MTALTSFPGVTNYWLTNETSIINYLNNLNDQGLRPENSPSVYMYWINIRVFPKNTNLTFLAFLQKLTSGSGWEGLKSFSKIKSCHLPPAGIKFPAMTITDLEVWHLSICAK